MKKLDLTDRQELILHYIAAGYKQKDIASELIIGTQTIKSHMTNMRKRNNLWGETNEFVIYMCLKQGLLNESFIRVIADNRLLKSDSHLIGFWNG